MEKILKDGGTGCAYPKTAEAFRELLTRNDKPGADGKLSARERLAALFDEGTFTELGAYTVRRRDSEPASDGALEGVIGGYGAVDGCLVYAFAEDLTRTKAAVSDATADKIANVYRLAVENGCPVVGCFESAGADLVAGVRALAGYGRIMKAVSAASGVIPQIAVVSGAAQGASAVLVSMFDFVVATEKSVVSVSPAFVVGGGHAEDSAANGIATVTVKDDAEAMACARCLLSCIPSNNEEGAVENVTEDDPDREVDLTSFASDRDARALLDTIGDAGSFVEIGKNTAPSVVTGFVSFDGTVCGTVATDHAKDGGRLTSLGARKAAKFVNFCDCFGIPVVTLVDSEGFASSAEEEMNPFAAELAKLASAYASAKTPLVTLVTGCAYGSVFSVLGSKSLGADVVFALDSARIACLNPAAGVALLWNDQITGSVTRESLETDYEETEANVIHAARCGEVDDIIASAEVRQRVTSAVLMLSGKSAAAPRRRHANLPL